MAGRQPSPPDAWETYAPLDRAGRGRRMSGCGEGHALYDDFGPGFTLIDFGAPDGAAALPTQRARAPCRSRFWRWRRSSASPYRHRLILVRPDQHIAWHGDRVTDATAIIDRVRGDS